MIVYANGKTLGTDLDGNTQPISVIGAEQDTLKVGDLNSSWYLHEILKELKIMNLHLNDITDIGLESSDIEV